MGVRIVRRGFLTATGCALAVTACGSGSPRKIIVVVDRPAHAVWCPTRSDVTDPVAHLGSSNRATSGSFDTRNLLGLTVQKATDVARAHGCLLRVIQRNGHGLIITADALTDRVNVSVDHGTVTATGVW